jgi:signal transduction histidine kinase
LTSAAAATVSSVVHDGLTVEASLDPATTTGDPRLIERLANLVSNAITHNTPDGRVSISTGTHEGRAILTVANTGPVVPATNSTVCLSPSSASTKTESPPRLRARSRRRDESGGE